MEIDRRRSETSYVTFLRLYLFLSLPLLSFTLSVCTSLTLSVYYVSCHTSLFLRVLPYVCRTESNRTHHPHVRSLSLFLCCVFYRHLLLPSLSFPFLSFHTAETMQFKKSWCNIMQTAREPPPPAGGLSLLHLDAAPKAIWLELLRSGWSAVIFQPVQISFTLMTSELLPPKIRAGWRLTGATVFHTVRFLYFFFFFFFNSIYIFNSGLC